MHPTRIALNSHESFISYEMPFLHFSLQDKTLQPAIEEQKRLMKQFGNELSYDVMQVCPVRNNSGEGLWLAEQQGQQQSGAKKHGLLCGVQHTAQQLSMDSRWSERLLRRWRDPELHAGLKTKKPANAALLPAPCLQDMEVLHRNITEALRMHPPLVLLLRYCKEPFTVTTSQGKQYTIPKVRAAGLGRDGVSGTPAADLIKAMSQAGRFYRG